MTKGLSTGILAAGILIALFVFVRIELGKRNANIDDLISIICSQHLYQSLEANCEIRTVDFNGFMNIGEYVLVGKEGQEVYIVAGIEGSGFRIISISVNE